MSKIIKSFRVVENPDVSVDLNQKINDNIKGRNDSINEKEYGKLIAEAKIKAKKIIEEANETAKLNRIKSELEIKEKMDNSINEINKLKEEFKLKGYNEGVEEGNKIGYEEGFKVGKLESDNLVKDALKIKEDYIEKREKLIKDTEEDIINLVIVIFEKIFAEKVEDKNFIVNIVSEGIKKLDPVEKLVIICSKEDYTHLDEKKDIILASGSLIEELEIKYDINLKKGDCILKTDKGSIDLSVEEQLSEVKLTLEKILNNE